MERRLRGHGYTVATYPSVARFFERPDLEAPGCVLADLQMPKRNGFDLQKTLAKSNNPLPVVFVPGKGDIPTSGPPRRGERSLYSATVNCRCSSGS